MTAVKARGPAGTPRRIAAVRGIAATAFAALVLAAAVLAGCAGPSGGGTSADGSSFDDADVTFTTAMVPHHAQAILMARMAPAHGASGHVEELAQQILAEQGPEIVQMQDLLSQWGRPPAPTASMSPTGGMAGMPGMGATDVGQDLVQGMMTDEQMRDLTAATGPAFDRLFLQMMIDHHQGAVTMAKTELSDGENTDAQVLAENISDTQLAQITLMRQLLKSG